MCGGPVIRGQRRVGWVGKGKAVVLDRKRVSEGQHGTENSVYGGVGKVDFFLWRGEEALCHAWLLRVGTKFGTSFCLLRSRLRWRCIVICGKDKNVDYIASSVCCFLCDGFNRMTLLVYGLFVPDNMTRYIAWFRKSSRVPQGRSHTQAPARGGPSGRFGAQRPVLTAGSAISSPRHPHNRPQTAVDPSTSVPSTTPTRSSSHHEIPHPLSMLSSQSQATGNRHLRRMQKVSGSSRMEPAVGSLGPSWYG